MAADRPAPYYGATTVTNASVPEFVAGFQARNAAQERAGLTGALVGIVATGILRYASAKRQERKRS